MATRADLYDGCPTAHALDLIGDRWALLVVRELLLGPKRFTDLQRGLPRISRNVLSQRLDDLKAAGVLSRRTLPPPSSSAVYALTDRGLELEPVLQAIGHWGVRSPLLPTSDSLGADTFVLGLRAHFQASRATDLKASYELRIAEDVFAFYIDHGRLTVRRGACHEPHLKLDVDPGAMAAIARGAKPLATALTTSGSGSDDDIARFAQLFAVPQPPASQPAAPPSVNGHPSTR
jgi:DNA-binding HxlR family transcriptional regulator